MDRARDVREVQFYSRKNSKTQAKTMTLETQSPPQVRINLHEEHAREKYALPPEWTASQFACFPLDGPTLYVQLIGAVYEPVTRGPRKGKPNWDKPIGKKTTAILPIADHEAWVRAWERRTGKCSSCVGTGQTIARCSAAGTEWRDCRICGGTGRAK